MALFEGGTRPGRLSTLSALVMSVAACAPAARDTTRGDGVAPAVVVTTSIKLDNFGYRPQDPKVAVFSSDPGSAVQVRTPAGAVVFTVPVDGGSIRSMGTDPQSGDRIWWLDLGPFAAPGRYRLFSNRLQASSYEFVIAPRVYGDVLRAAVRTFYLQRCGLPKTVAAAGAWSDGSPCHLGDRAAGPAPGNRDLGRRDLSGGWHDAGDYNKYVWYSVSNAVLFLLGAFEDDPGAFPDGGLGIPESGNGVSDLLDEVRWELDFLLKMQLDDGSVLSQVHAAESASGAAPPSADRTVRFYRDPNPESAAVLAGSCALAARVFAASGQVGYAARLKRAALAAWGWLQGRGDGDEKVWAAAEVFRLDPSVESARRYVDGYHPAGWSGATLEAMHYDTHAATTYVQAAGATPAVVSGMKKSMGGLVDAIFSSDDLYRNGMPDRSYYWGSNGVRAGRGVFLLRASRLGATGRHSPGECRLHALDTLHFFHGQNPLSMVYLTNMASLGGEHSSWQVFHNWFGQSGDGYSRSRYVGKPSSVVEPHYPYFAGTDNHGIRDDKASALGPAPGLVPGGPSKDYSGDAIPPGGDPSYPGRSYRDWNDQAVWTARTWEITETSIGYEGPYVALVAAFVEP